MRQLRAFVLRLAGIFGGTRRDRDLADELDAHLAMHAEDNLRAGMTPEESRRAALLRLGGVDATSEHCRDRRGVPRLEAVLKDFGFAARVLRKNSAFGILTISVLALGIGANAAIFSIVSAVLLRPLPFRNPEGLVRVWHTPPQRSFPGVKTFAVSPANYIDWEAQNHVFERMAIYGFSIFNLTGTGEPEVVIGRMVSRDFFSVLSVEPMLGRVFAAEELEPGHEKVVIPSYALWQARFGSNLEIIGESVRLDGQPYTVVGVMPSTFRFPTNAQIWTPLAWTPKDRAVRNNHNEVVIARLKAGVDMKQAQAEMDAISRSLEVAYPADDKGWGAVVVPLHEDIVGDIRPLLLVLLGAVALVLLIACANVANLSLARALDRRKEIAIRSALGAGRGRVLQQVLCESLLLALGGGAVGLLLAHFGIDGLIALLKTQLPLLGDISLDRGVLAFTLGVSIFTGVASGLAPAWHLTRTNLNEGLKQGLGRTDGKSGGSRIRSVLVVSEVALSLMLTIAAGLLIRSLWLLHAVDPGFDPHHVLTLSIAAPPVNRTDKSRQTAFLNRVLDRVRVLPGVESAGATIALPSAGTGGNWPVQVEGQPVVQQSDQPEVTRLTISPGYVRTMRIPLLRGRDFTEADKADSPLAALVSESFAKRFFPRGNPIGRHLESVFFPGRWEIVGVLGDVKQRGLGAVDPVAMLYLPAAQAPIPFMRLVVRTRLEPYNLAPAVTRAVREIDPEQPVRDVESMDDVLETSLSQRRMSMLLLAGFAALALLLAGMGIYSVLAYAVRRQLRELGIRMALGARIGDVLRMILSSGLRPVVAGILIGTAGALAASRVLARLVFGISTADLPTFAIVCILLVVVGLFASLIPAWRASLVDPIRVLRDE